MTKQDSFGEKINTSFGYVCSEIFNDADPKRISSQIAAGSHINYILAYNYEDKAVSSLNSIFSPFASESGTDPDKNFYPFVQSGNVRVSPDVRNKYVVDDDTTNEFWYVSGQNYTTSVYAYNALKLTYGTSLTVGDEQPNQGESNEGTQAGRIRAVGFSVPQVFVGWGYSSAGRPVPSIVDYMKTSSGGLVELDQLTRSGTFQDFSPPVGVSPTISGEYRTDYIRDMVKARKRLDDRHNTFYKDFDSRQDLWRAGTLDLVWNDTRKVWGMNTGIKEGYMTTDLFPSSGRLANPNYTSGELVLYDGYGSNWRKIEPDKKIWVINRSTDLDVESGTYMIAKEMPNGEYRPIWVDCEIEPSGVPSTYNNSVLFGDL